MQVDCSYYLTAITAVKFISNSKFILTVSVTVQVSIALTVLEMAATTVPAPEYLIPLTDAPASAIASIAFSTAYKTNNFVAPILDQQNQGLEAMANVAARPSAVLLSAKTVLLYFTLMSHVRSFVPSIATVMVPLKTV